MVLGQPGPNPKVSGPQSLSVNDMLNLGANGKVTFIQSGRDQVSVGSFCGFAGEI